MRSKSLIFNFSLLAALLFSALYQPVHSLEHIIAEFSSHKCHHETGKGKFELTHDHNEFDHCFSCEFTLSSFIESDIYVIKQRAASAQSGYIFVLTTIFINDRAPAFSLRGPPVSIC